MPNNLIGIVAANNIRYSPYIFFYANIFDECGIEYELIYPDRNHVIDSWNGVSHKIAWDKRIHSLLNYKIYTNKVIKIIKEKQYSKLIVLTGQIAVFMGLWLRKNYNKQYIVDIRDYTFENFYLYALLEKVALESAGHRVLSSKKFMSFLPKMDYLIAHNISFSLGRDSLWKKHADPIVIGYVGSVAYKEMIFALIRLVKADLRFNFYIYGAGPDQVQVKEAVEKANCERIRYFGPYKPSEKSLIIQNVDILFNAYGNESPLQLYALSNKLYDAMHYRKLILNSPGTFMEEMSGTCGYSIDLMNESSLKGLHNWYEKLNESLVTLYQNKMESAFIEENNLTKQSIIRFVLEEL